MNRIINYSTGTSTLGEFFFATTDEGLVMFEPGVTLSHGVARLQMKFPDAILSRDDQGLNELAMQLAALTEAPGQENTIPLFLAGDPFEMRVWSLLQTIPAGERVSYGELAKKLGEPREAQKVARACAANTLAILVPCHRVVKKDGSLSGYRWGYWRKKALLEREQALQQPSDFVLEGNN